MTFARYDKNFITPSGERRKREETVPYHEDSDPTGVLGIAYAMLLVCIIGLVLALAVAPHGPDTYYEPPANPAYHGQQR